MPWNPEHYNASAYEADEDPMAKLFRKESGSLFSENFMKDKSGAGQRERVPKSLLSASVANDDILNEAISARQEARQFLSSWLKVWFLQQSVA